MPGLLRGVARTAVIAGTATGGQQPRLAPPGPTLAAAGDLPVRPAGVRLRAAGARAPSPPAAHPIQQLKDLAELKDRAILTEEEFAAQKAKIIGS